MSRQGFTHRPNRKRRLAKTKRQGDGLATILGYLLFLPIIAIGALLENMSNKK